jgi:pimeloyl-ACP methyl ester carboxylesterase
MTMGTPLFAVPLQPEQVLNAVLVEKLDAARRLTTASATTATALIREMLADDGDRLAAKRMALMKIGGRTGVIPDADSIRLRSNIDLFHSITAGRQIVLLKITLATALIVGAFGAPASAKPPPPEIAWARCPADATAQCGTMSVPADWAHPRGPRIDIEVARRFATDPANRVGSLVFGPGGPGDSGVDRTVTGMSRFSPELQSRFDIVSLDPRGVGKSTPAVCTPSLVADRPPPILTSQADFDATVAFNRALYKDCRTQSGGLIDHYDSISAARDLDALRQALGEEKLTFHGSSYGTLLGEMYAEQFPHRVRAIVLESAVDHSADVSGFFEPQARAVQDSFDEFAAWCGAAPDCALYGYDVRAVWNDVLGKASRHELGEATPWDVRVTAFRAFYVPNWRTLATKLRTAYDGTGPFAFDRLPPVAFPVFCDDWSLPVASFGDKSTVSVRDYAEYATLMRRVGELSPDTGYPPAVFAATLCLGWPKPIANPQHRLRIGRLQTPMLLLKSAHDPGTGDTWAHNVARQAGDRNAVIVTYQGWGHGAYNPRTNPCATAVVDRYLIDLAVPAPGTTCPAVTP